MGTKTVIGVKRSREQELDDNEVGPVAEALLDLVPEPAEAEDSVEGRSGEKIVEPPTTVTKKSSKSKKKKKGGKVRKVICLSHNPAAAEQVCVLQNGSKEDEEAAALELASAMVCESCRGGHYEDKIILCDRCDRGWHMFCLAPPLKKVPKGDWVCPVCDAARKGDKGPLGEEISLSEFHAKANDFESQWYENVDASRVNHVEREREFWNIVCGGEDIAEVLYVNDQRVQLKRTEAQKKKGFGSIQNWKNELSENLSSYCQNENEGVIPGLHQGFLQFGMTFSSSPWEVEDQLLHSMTYLHSGAVKQWYCIPSYASSMFDSLIQQLHSDYMLSMEWESPLGPNLMVPPTAFIERGVPVYGCTQEEGSIVLCFSNSYHCSVNLGLNVSEKTLVVLPEWLRGSSQAISLYRNHRVPPVFCVENLILNCFGKLEKLGIETRYWLSRECERIAQEETMLRYKLWGEGLRQYRRITDEDEKDATSTKKVTASLATASCCVCRHKLVFSMVECPCSPRKAVCLHHRQHLCKCKISRHRLAWKYSLEDIQRMQEVFIKSVGEYSNEIIANEKAISEDVQHAIRNAVVSARIVEEEMREVVMTSMGNKMNNKKSSKDSKSKKKAKLNDQESMCRTDPGSMDADGPGAPMTSVTECGYVQGPIRPFAHLDLHPEDFETLEIWRRELEENCKRWIANANLTLEEGGLRAYELPDLVEEADEYLWGSVSPGLRETVEKICPKLEEADDFVDQVFVALNGKPALEDAEKLISTDPLPIKSPPRINELRSSVSAAKEWIQKHSKLATDLKIDPPVDSKLLDAVAAEASKIPITISEAKILKERLVSIKKVAEAVRVALPKNRDTGRRKNSEDPLTLEFLEKLHADSQSAHIMMPEVVTLNAAIDKIHLWRSRVETALEKRSTWAEYQELIDEGKAMPCEMPDIQRLYELQDSVNIWIDQMRSMKAQNASVKQMRDLLEQGNKLPIQFDEINELSEYLQKFEWEELAKKMLHSPSDIDDLERAIASVPLNNERASEVAKSLQQKIIQARSWLSSAEEFLRLHSNSLPSLSEVETLVGQGEDIGVKMPLLSDFSIKLIAAKKWLNRCNKCLSGVSASPLDPPVLEERRIPLVNFNHPMIRSRVIWMETGVRDRLPTFTTVDTLISEYNDLGIQLPVYDIILQLHRRAEQWQADADEILNQTDLREEQIPLVETLIAKGLRTGLRIAQVDNLESYLHAFIWQQTVVGILDCIGNRNIDSQSSLPSLDLLVALVDEGDKFAINTEIYKQLKKLSSSGIRWQKEAHAILRNEKPKIVSLQHIYEFLERGKSLGVKFSGSEIEDIASLVAEHEMTCNHLLQVLQSPDASQRVSLAQISDAYNKLLAHPIDSEVKSRIVKEIKSVEKLEQSHFAGLGGTLGKIPMKSALEYMESTINSANCQLDKMVRNERWAVGSDEEEDVNALFCLCQQTSAADANMVACDKCSDWYHATCVGWNQFKVDDLFLCPVCSAGLDTDDVSKAVRKLKPHKVSSIEDIRLVQKMVQKLPLISQMERNLDSIMKSYSSWFSTLKSIENQAEEHLYNDSTTDWPLLGSLLRQLIKSSLVIEIGCMDICSRLLKLLRVHIWRKDALDLIHHARDQGMPLRSLILELRDWMHQAPSKGVDIANNALYLKLDDSISKADDWEAQATQAIQEMKAAADAQSPQFYKLQSRILDLLKASETLYLPAGETVADLKDYSVPYCICRRVIQEDNKMIGCDICEEWFHFDCIGCDSKQFDENVPWICPICSFGKGISYMNSDTFPPECQQTLAAIKDVMPALKDCFGEDAYKTSLKIFNSPPFQYFYSNGLVSIDQATSPENRELYETLRDARFGDTLLKIEEDHKPNSRQQVTNIRSAGDACGGRPSAGQHPVAASYSKAHLIENSNGYNSDLDID
jgi:hypothetical protein